jgi:hypothetical protein
MFQLVKAITFFDHITTTTMAALSQPTKMLTKHMFLNLESTLMQTFFFLSNIHKKEKKGYTTTKGVPVCQVISLDFE